MADHRYWRALGFEAWGAGNLELSEFQLLASNTRIDGAATLTANIVPTTGVLSSLQDDTPAVSVEWAASGVAKLILQWDFGGSPVSIDDIRLGSGAAPERFPLMLRLHWSDDGSTWTEFITLAGITWPGPHQLPTNAGGGLDPFQLFTTSLLHFDGANNSTVFVDELANSWAAFGDARIGTARSKFGGAAGQFSGTSGGYLSLATKPALELGNKDFTFEANIFLENYPINNSGFYSSCVCAKDTITPGGRSYSFQINGTAISFTSMSFTGFATDTTYTLVDVPFAFALNRWYHVAAVRKGNLLYLFIDGVLRNPGGTAFSVNVQVTPSPLTIASNHYSAVFDYFLRGWIDEFRLTNGYGRYTADFTVPDSPFASGGIALNRVPGRSDVGDLLMGAAAPAIPIYGTTGLALTPQPGRQDYVTGVLGQGIGRIAGTVKEAGLPEKAVQRRVRLHRERDGLLIREVWSDPITGNYEFQYVDERQTYTVISHDHNGNFNAVVKASITPEVMP